MSTHEEERKIRRAAEGIVAAAPRMPAGTSVGVVGNNLSHAERIVAVAREFTELQGVSLEHITFVPISGEALARLADKGADTSAIVEEVVSGRQELTEPESATPAEPALVHPGTGTVQ